MAGQTQSLSERIDELLPQTQCTRCGYPDCRRYAQAIAADAADINQCPPGGQSGIDALARLLGREPKPLNPANGVEKPREIAAIDEQACIGCTKCIAACPVDAIIGASKAMHTVLVDECSGCELCIAPCPVDCIVMIPAPDANAAATQLAPRYRARYAVHNARIAREESERVAALNARKRELEASSADSVAAAIARANARRSGRRQ